MVPHSCRGIGFALNSPYAPTAIRAPWPQVTSQCGSRLRSRRMIDTFSSTMLDSLSDRLAGTVPGCGGGGTIKGSRGEESPGCARDGLPLPSVRHLLAVVSGARSMNPEPSCTDCTTSALGLSSPLQVPEITAVSWIRLRPEHALHRSLKGCLHGLIQTAKSWFGVRRRHEVRTDAARRVHG